MTTLVAVCAATGPTMARSRPQASSTDSAPRRAPRELVMEGQLGERIAIPPSGAKLVESARVANLSRPIGLVNGLSAHLTYVLVDGGLL